eukprot:TRINITY_DN15602_c0_g1_i2.p1 TRINITY_DN15602_c0_g1~~TRINITY_DN15602_c0_g1_i2.p1  ORF type:complete len:296 (-),score=50.36 TRINITY_DN15602_c0_g1_i2:244-1131(-)
MMRRALELEDVLQQTMAAIAITPHSLVQCEAVCKQWNRAAAAPGPWSLALKHTLFPSDHLPCFPLAKDIFITMCGSPHFLQFCPRHIALLEGWLGSKVYDPTTICGGATLDAHPILSQWPGKQCQVAYFEVRVIGGASVGVATVGEDGWDEHIGWRNVGYGYHSDDGSIWRSDSVHTSNGMDGQCYGPAYGKLQTPRFLLGRPQGDVVGCGMDFVQKHIFFTLNGKLLGIAFEDVEIEGLRQAAALHEKHDALSFNLGAEPFCWNLPEFIAGGAVVEAPDPSCALPVNNGLEFEL